MAAPASGLGRSRSRAPGEVRPDREEHSRPLLGRVGDHALEGRGDGRQRRRDALPAGALGGDRDRPDPAGERAVGGAPDADREDRRARSRSRAAPARSGAAPARRRTGPRSRRRRCRDRRRSRRRRRAERRRSSRRAARSPTIRTPSEPRVRSNHSWSARVVDRLHRRHEGPAERWARYSAGSSIGPKWGAAKITGPPAERASTTVGRLDDHAVIEDRRRQTPERAGSPGSSAHRAGRRGGRAAREPRASLAAAARPRALPVSRRSSSPAIRAKFRRAWAAPSRREPVPQPAGERRRGRRAPAPGGGRPPTRRREDGQRPVARASPAGWRHGRVAGRSRGASSGRPAPPSRSPSSTAGAVGRRRAAVVGPPSIRRARRELGGFLGGRRPDRLEAVPLVRRRGDGGLERVGDRLRRPRELGRGGRRRRSAARTRRGTSRRRRVGSRPAGSPSRSSPRASPGRPAASSTPRRAAPERRRSDSPSRSGARASRRFLSTAKISRRLRQGITWTPHCSRSRLKRSNISGNDESSATTLIGQPRLATPAATASLLPTWPRAKISPPPGATATPPRSGRGRSGRPPLDRLVRRQRLPSRMTSTR